MNDKIQEQIQDQLQHRLHDIVGFDELSSWPPAPIWWILIDVLLVITTALFYRRYKKNRYKKTWQYDAICKLDELEQQLDEKNAHKSLLELSELIKRIIMQHYGREQCAALTGKKLLIWLKQKDPNGFNWEERGKLLTETIYAPNNSAIDLKEIKVLIEAIRKLTKINGGRV